MINILMCGVGGQGLVLASGIITEVSKLAGYDVKSNDVIGLSQRGGRVWANIRVGEKIYSPNIPEGETDYMLALEPLEGYRYSPMLKKTGIVFMNKRIIYPSDVVFEKAEYPNEAIENMLNQFESYAIDATEKGVKLGNKMVANTIILGMLAKKMPIGKALWESVLLGRVPEKSKAINQAAFDFGYEFVT